MADIFLLILHATHFSRVKLNETIISEKLIAKFLILSVFSLDIFHVVNIGR